MANVIIGDIASATGGNVLKEVYLPLGTADFATVAEDIRRLQPDVVINTLNGDSNLHFFKALHEAGLGQIPVLSFSVSETELQAMGPQSFHPNHYAVWSYFQSLPTPDNHSFVATFKARFGADRVTSDPIVATYDAVRLWAGAVVKAGSAEPEDVNQALASLSIAGPAGITAVDISTHHVWRPTRIGLALPSGQFEMVFDSEDTVRPSPYPMHRSMGEWERIVATLQSTRRVDPP